MSWRDKLIALLRRYLDRDEKMRMARRITSPDQDHRSLAELLKGRGIRGVCVEMFAAPHHGSDDKIKISIYLAQIVERLLQSLMIHKDLKPSNILRYHGGTDRPPRVAQFLLLLIPKKNREHLVGDLEEEYRTKVLPEWGRFRARFFYWEQTAIAVICYLWPAVKRLLGLAAIWKVIGR